MLNNHPIYQTSRDYTTAPLWDDVQAALALVSPAKANPCEYLPAIAP